MGGFILVTLRKFVSSVRYHLREIVEGPLESKNQSVRSFKGFELKVDSGALGLGLKLEESGCRLVVSNHIKRSLHLSYPLSPYFIY